MVVKVGVCVGEGKEGSDTLPYWGVRTCVSPCMFERTPLIQALENVSLLRAVCMRPQITAHDLRQVCRKVWISGQQYVF